MASRFLDLGLSNIMLGVKVDVLLHSGIRNIMLLGNQNISASFFHK